VIGGWGGVGCDWSGEEELDFMWVCSFWKVNIMMRIDISGDILSSCVSLRLGTYESNLVRRLSLSFVKSCQKVRGRS
jgi:hypothetical protein